MRQSTIYRWTPLIIATVLVVMITPVFWVTDLDIKAAALFFDPTNPDNPWPSADAPLWAFFYEASWLLSLAIMITSFGLVIAAKLGKLSPVWAPRGWALLLVLVLGAGLIVNLGFKDNFGRYRPRQTVDFLGAHQYQMPLEPGIPGTGRSFPSGHPTPAFALSLLYFFWRLKNPRLAWIALFSSLSLGALMGVGRMAAGAHFLSDIIWSGYLMFGTAAFVYYGLMRVPEQELRLEGGIKTPFTTSQKISLASVLTLAIGISVFTKPIGHESVYELDATSVSLLDSIELRFDKAELEIEQIPDGEPLVIDVVSLSFGAPGASVRREITESPGSLIFDLYHEGHFTEKGTTIHVSVPESAVDKLIIEGRPD